VEERQQRMAKATQLIELARRIAEALLGRDHEHDLVSEELVEKRSLFRKTYEPVREHIYGWALIGPRRVMVPSDRGQLYYADGVLLAMDGTILVFGQGHIGRDAFNTGVPSRAPVPDLIRLMEDDGVCSWTFALDTPAALADAQENPRFQYLARSTTQYAPIPVTVDAIEAGMAALWPVAGLILGPCADLHWFKQGVAPTKQPVGQRAAIRHLPRRLC
jgi:hypothetical protein